jgi:imidazolonepropionase-like amidohydrolase
MTAAHALGPDALPLLIAAGVDSVEHGTALDDTHIAAMATHGTALVPTLLATDTMRHRHPRRRPARRRILASPALATARRPHSRRPGRPHHL